MGTLYFVRHGESIWNVDKRVCGSIDVPLTQRGRDMARETGDEIKRRGLKIDRIISSPLKRAFETATIISSVIGVKVEEDPRISEQAFGKWEGKILIGDMGFVEAKKSFAISYEGGESMLKTAHRVYSLLDQIKEDRDNNYLIVAHNGIARFVQSYFFDMTNDEFAAHQVPNCSITEYEI